MKSRTHIRSILHMLLLALFVGFLGSVSRQPALGVVGGAAIAVIYGAFFQLLGSRRGVRTGLLTGSLLGGLLGGINFLFPSAISWLPTGLLWGFVKGALLGSVLGLLTRPEPDEEDLSETRLFLIVGSLFLGVFLGGLIGLLAEGMVLLFQGGGGGMLLALGTGGIVGGYLGSYFGVQRMRLYGAVVGTAVSLVATIGLAQPVALQATSGLLLGGISGAIAPMIWFGLIGFYGGTRRGVQAAFVEAAQAPTEMIRQGFVPFFGPAFLIGATVGTAVFPPASLIMLILLFSGVGLALGVVGELTDNPNHAMTISKIVEMVITGSDSWPPRQAIDQILRQGRVAIWVGIGTGLLTGVLGAVLGALGGQLLLHLLF